MFAECSPKQTNRTLALDKPNVQKSESSLESSDGHIEFHIQLRLGGLTPFNGKSAGGKIIFPV